MRKWLLPIALVAAVVVVVVLVAGGGSGNSGYVVRGIFDSGGFMVAGEEVRVAGATVGEIESVGVTMPGEVDSYKNGKSGAVPGKAVIAMKIADPGFQDFRSDASCLIRPQSLIGEKFVDCRPTLPRAPGSKPAPPLKQIAEGEPGAGQYLLPFENNSTSVDPDLINNISQLTYTQRFRLILNELGAGFAGRGEDVEEVVKRANPVLRDVVRVFGILNAQRDRLAQLASDSEQILGPLSRDRASVAGFFSNAGAAAQASAEEGTALEASLQKLPAFLRELRQTMGSFEYFSKAGTPVSESLAKAAPALTKATRALTPFSAASTVSLKSLGASGEVAGPKIRAADPVVKKIRDLGRSGAVPTTELASFLASAKQNKAFDGIADVIYNSAATTNEFDQYGHFTRTLAQLTNCNLYSVGPTSSCSANFSGPGASTSSVFDPAAAYARIQEELTELGGGTSAGASSVVPQAPAPATPVPGPGSPGLGESERLGARAKAVPQRAVLDYLLGP
jgi:phospholipid/cholesterol/gamma-HCH transport system substrate-binding protein